MVKHENYATRDQLYSLFFFFNYFEFNSIWVCVCVRGPFTHWNRSLEWKFWEREKYELNKNTQNRTILFVDCGIVFHSRANAITKRNLRHALDGEIVWMTWAVNKRAHLNRIESNSCSHVCAWVWLHWASCYVSAHTDHMVCIIWY